jgi:hypothetical protein
MSNKSASIFFEVCPPQISFFQLLPYPLWIFSQVDHSPNNCVIAFNCVEDTVRKNSAREPTVTAINYTMYPGGDLQSFNAA